MNRAVRIAQLVLTMVMLFGPAASAQSTGFEDVPPWHWASDAVQTVAAAGIFVGYPATDRDRALNALVQVYDAFLHAAHPGAREWAERFLVNLPPDWPQPLQRSRLLRFSLEGARVEAAAGGLVVAARVVAVLRTDGGSRESRAVLRVDVQRDNGGRLRVNYAALAAAQPEVFR